LFDIAILGQVALAYSPFIDARRQVAATRLTVFPLRPDVNPDAAQLLHAVGGVWPATGGRVSLNVLSETLLQDLLLATPTPNLMIEVPAFMINRPESVAAVQALHRAGNVLLVKGRPIADLPRELLPCFRYTIVDQAQDRRLAEVAGARPATANRTIEVVQSGVRTMSDLDAAFQRGAAAVLGWPIDDALPTPATPSPRATAKSASTSPTDIQVIVELIQRVDAGDPIDRIEATLKRDPGLAFRLIRFINSPGFGLRVEISSFRHAVMMLGYKRLKRWLALLLATGSDDPRLRPLMFCAVRRGLLMEELIAGTADEDLRSEIFICGVFSLLDRMFQQPMDQLLAGIPVPDRVRQCLIKGSGPFQTVLTLVQAIEAESLFDIRNAADTLMLSISEVNRALLRALSTAIDVQ
jgi:c-di-GMP phosphodiesterase